MSEQWRDIQGYEGLYQVSDMGNIKSIKRTKKGRSNGVLIVEERIMKPRSTKRTKSSHNTEYLTVSLSKDGKKKTEFVHRLVAKAFVDNPNNKLCVNHKNGNGFDNRSDNLEWVTNSENINHAWNTGLMNENTRHAMSEKAKKRTGKANSCWRGEVAIINPDDVIVAKVETLKNAAEWISKNTSFKHADKGNISLVCNGKLKQVYGYKFTYIKEIQK